MKDEGWGGLVTDRLAVGHLRVAFATEKGQTEKGKSIFPFA